MSYKNELRKKEIKLFIQENEPCTFGQIKEHIAKTKFAFKISDENNNKPLARELKELSNEGKILHDTKAKPKPTYSIVKDHELVSAIMGEFFRNELFPFGGRTLKDGIEKSYFYEMGNPNMDDDYLNYDYDEKFVKYMIMRYGFFLLSVFVKSHEQSITNKNFNKKEWMEHALNLFQNEEWYSNIFLRLMFNKKDIDEPLNIDNKKLKSKIKRIKKTMGNLYPEHYEELQFYEDHTEKDEDYIKLLKENKRFMKKFNSIS